MRHLITGINNNTLKGKSAIRYMTEIPNSFVGISDEGQAMYDEEEIIYEIFDLKYPFEEWMGASDIEVGEMFNESYREFYRLINKYELLLDIDDDILIFKRNSKALDMIQSSQEESVVQFAISDLLIAQK